MTEYIDTVESKERLAADLRQLITDAEDLIHITAHNSEGKAVALRERMIDNLKAARHKLADVEDAIKDRLFPSPCRSAGWLR